MSDTVIRVENLAKLYRIGARQQKYRTLRDAIRDAALKPIRKLTRRGTDQIGENTFWALKNITFEVRRGEVIGIIGRNGAGKSTLLKILSRITEPSEGYAEIRGRVGSLLEVGTGFHPELTGRENIFLNGAILGMRRAEIERQFDEIVAFAEVEKFVDTPIKHYSSGMYLRLAFAVAAHLDPEILMVDEVLAVGDSAFQKKCIGKMGEIATQGRTVFFVSHNLGAVRELCTSGIVLANGKLEYQGQVSESVARYSRRVSDSEEPDEIRGTGWRSIELQSNAGTVLNALKPGRPVFVCALLELQEAFASGRLIVLIDNAVGETVVHRTMRFTEAPTGMHRVRAEIAPIPLAPGVYTVYMKFLGQQPSGFTERHVSDRIVLEVDGSIQDLGRAVLAPPCEWEMTPAGAAKPLRTASL